MSINSEDFLRHKGGLSKNDLTKVLNLDNNGNLIKLKSEYYSVDELCCFLDKHHNKLTLLSLNINSLNSRYDELCILVDTLAKSNVQIFLICIQEARIQLNADINHLKLNNYTMLTHAYTDTCSKKGGLVIYVLDSLSIRNYTNFNTYSTWEGLAVEINYNSEKSITVCNIYRPPRDNNGHASIDFFLKIY